mmetsp:Transcript_108798/g.307749  ORF Transcript_108798/g.307749 Transcript_108798/m.307749 type:complete len:899 (+) Transcript_108798:69-2765(+)
MGVESPNRPNSSGSSSSRRSSLDSFSDGDDEDTSTAFVAQIEFPSLNQCVQLTFTAKSDSIGRLVGAWESMFEQLSTDFRDDLKSIDTAGSNEKLQRLRSRAAAELTKLQEHMKETATMRSRAERAEASEEKMETRFAKMRAAYFKELSHLREQLGLMAAASKRGEKIDPSNVQYFKPDEFLTTSEWIKLVDEKVIHVRDGYLDRLDRILEALCISGGHFQNANTSWIGAVLKRELSRDAQESSEDQPLVDPLKRLENLVATMIKTANIPDTEEVEVQTLVDADLVDTALEYMFSREADGRWMNLLGYTPKSAQTNLEAAGSALAAVPESAPDSPDSPCSTASRRAGDFDRSDRPDRPDRSNAPGEATFGVDACTFTIAGRSQGLARSATVQFEAGDADRADDTDGQNGASQAGDFRPSSSSSNLRSRLSRRNTKIAEELTRLAVMDAGDVKLYATCTQPLTAPGMESKETQVSSCDFLLPPDTDLPEAQLAQIWSNWADIRDGVTDMRNRVGTLCEGAEEGSAFEAECSTLLDQFASKHRRRSSTMGEPAILQFGNDSSLRVPSPGMAHMRKSRGGRYHRTGRQFQKPGEKEQPVGQPTGWGLTTTSNDSRGLSPPRTPNGGSKEGGRRAPPALPPPVSSGGAQPDGTGRLESLSPTMKPRGQARGPEISTTTGSFGSSGTLQHAPSPGAFEVARNMPGEQPLAIGVRQAGQNRKGHQNIRHQTHTMSSRRSIDHTGEDWELPTIGGAKPAGRVNLSVSGAHCDIPHGELKDEVRDQTSGARPPASRGSSPTPGAGGRNSGTWTYSRPSPRQRTAAPASPMPSNKALLLVGGSTVGQSVSAGQLEHPQSAGSAAGAGGGQWQSAPTQISSGISPRTQRRHPTAPGTIKALPALAASK